jgi:tRNA-binding EMAP/Myf-like protein
VCVLCNLKPVAMRGIKSHAMVLAASSEDHTKVSIMLSLSLSLFLLHSCVYYPELIGNKNNKLFC